MLKIPKFTIDSLPLESCNSPSKPSRLQGYSVVSTAPTNVEEQAWLIDWNKKSDGLHNQIDIVENDNNEQLNQMVKHLAASNKPEITISIHGYSMPWKAAWERNKGIYNYICKTVEDQKNNQVLNNQIFIGYRWQSEKICGDNPPCYYRQTQNKKDYRAKESTFRGNLGKAVNSLPAFLLGLVIFFVQTLGLSIFLYLYPPQATYTHDFLVFGLVTLFIYLIIKSIFEVTGSNNTSQLNCDRDRADKSTFSWRENLIYLAVLIITALVCIVFNFDVIFIAWLVVPYVFTWLILYLTKSENTFQFLPLIMSTCLSLLTYLYLCFLWQDSLNLAYFIISLVILVVTLAIFLLRLSNYFRDRYRATHYGVLDLVAFIREFENRLYDKYWLTAARQVCQERDDADSIIQAINSLEKLAEQSLPLRKTTEEIAEAFKRLNNKLEELNLYTAVRKHAGDRDNFARVKLNFIAHSMGCFIATNTVRILSNVFDSKAVEEAPSSELGRCLTLGRLVLAAPDIPVESISENVSNYLASSLRRCEEAYVFSNEADVVLRFASTAANFIGFPSKERFGGYRLGNVTINNFTKQAKKEYGIVNSNKDLELELSQVLELRASESEIKPVIIDKENSVAEEFTYFDCTDYIDIDKPENEENQPEIDEVKSILSFALRKRALSFALLNDYFWLALAQFLHPSLIRLLSFCYLPYLIYYPISSLFHRLAGKPMSKKIEPFTKNFTPRKLNTHGGYFQGEFIHNTICQLAFLGFEGHLAIHPELDREYRDKQIQVFVNKHLVSQLQK